MKNLKTGGKVMRQHNSFAITKLKAIIALAIIAIIGMSFSSCGDAIDAGGTVKNEKAVYTSVDAEGNVYELTITPQSNRTAYEPKAGDTYTLTIFYKDGTTKTSVGTVTYEVKSGSTVTATLSVSDASFTVTLSTVTDGLSVMTEIKGTIPITDDDNKPTIEIELALTPQVENESDVVIGVILNKTALELDVGGSETLVATVLPTNAKNKNVTWSSNDDAVVQVSQSGEVSALAVGNAVITVTTEEGKKPAICNVMVIEVDEIQMPVVEDFIISGLGTVSADGNPKAVIIQPKAGKSPGAITVLYNGSATAPSVVGTFTITFNVATANGWNSASGLSAGTLVIISGVVTNETPVAEDYNISGTGTVSADGAPKTVTIQPKSGKSPGAITVLYNGSTTAPSAVGTYAITFNVAAANGWNSAAGLTAGALVISATSISVTGVSLNKTTLEIGTGDIEYLTAIIEPANATNKNVTWKSSNEDVATVSELGTVTGIFPGSATITITTEDGGKTATCAVNVFLTPAGLPAYLDKLPANSASSPYNIQLRVRTEAEAMFISGALNAWPNNYVNIDLTGSTITSISTWSGFYGCTSLVSVTIPNSVTSIGVVAFAGCSSLTSIIIPNSVTSIGNEAFRYCTSLKSVTIGNSVISLGYYAFIGCTSIASVTFAEPSKVTSIGQSAFGGCSSLASIIIPNSVTSLGQHAFGGCPSLASVTFAEPSQVTSLDQTFYGCTSLASITIPNSVTIISWAFAQCTRLASVTFAEPSKVTSIGYDAFYGCTSLASITIPDSVTIIDGSAFYGCTSLANITIPNSVTSLGRLAFGGCTSLAIVTFAEPSEVISIGDGAFGSCTSLASIIIPNRVTSIGGSAFSSSGLTSITIPDSVTSIGDGAFYECTSLESVTIGSGLTSIGHGIFFICYSLASVTFAEPSQVTNIGENSFWSCTSLASITIPDSVKSIEDGAFFNCRLTSVTFQGTIPSSGFSNSTEMPNNSFPGDLRDVFYETNATYGTPGTYTRDSGFSNWTKQ